MIFRYTLKFVLQNVLKKNLTDFRYFYIIIRTYYNESFGKFSIIFENL